MKLLTSFLYAIAVTVLIVAAGGLLLWMAAYHPVTLVVTTIFLVIWTIIHYDVAH